MTRTGLRAALGSLATALIALPFGALAQQPSAEAMSPALSTCGDPATNPTACKAVRGDRGEGWLQQTRSEVMARNGMIATSQPLAAQAGLRILMQGGNAIDAAVATAATLNVVEPMNVGLAGDLFAIIYIAKDRSIHVLDASGTAPRAQTIAAMKALGYQADPKNFGPGSGMPPSGVLTVTVPGAAWGWEEVLAKFGTMTFKQTLEPAIDYAEKGFPISERVRAEWELPTATPLRACCTELDPDSVAVWYPNGKRPVVGQIFRNPDLAKTFRLLQKDGAAAFYKGEIAKAIVAKSNALGGKLTLADLAGYQGRWAEPSSSAYRGHEILELPPPSQGWAANEALNILAACVPSLTGKSLADLGPTDPLYWHLLIEAKKLAYTDLFAYNADPSFAKVPLERLLSQAYAQSLCSRIDLKRASSIARSNTPDHGGDTIVLSTADRWGNMVSWVNSNFASFGSGLTVPGYGFVLHNRGGLFSLDPKSPNAIAPGKRPFNTLSAAFVMRDKQPVMAMQLMGGDMQAQGHLQVLVDILDLGANVQAAGDIARFRHTQINNSLTMEAPLFDLVGAQLKAMGHDVSASNRRPMGGYQAIWFTPDASERAPGPQDHNSPVNGIYRAGSDFGKDGQAVGW